MRVKAKKGLLHYGTNKQSGSNNIEYLDDALKEQSKCHACGCNATEGFITLPDLNTADGDLFLIFIHDGALHRAPDTAANRAHFAECCRERAAGAPSTSCDALGALAQA